MNNLVERDVTTKGAAAAMLCVTLRRMQIWTSHARKTDDQERIQALRNARKLIVDALEQLYAELPSLPPPSGIGI